MRASLNVHVCMWDSRQQETLSEGDAQQERRNQQGEKDSEYGNDSSNILYKSLGSR